MTTVHVVVPDGIDDPARPSGGNSYDRRVCDELAASGWDVREVVVPGPWPRPDAAALSRLARAVGAVPDGGLVLLDGLIASAAGAVLVPEAARLRLVVLVHMPFGDVAVAADAECAVLSHVRAVVTTSAWTRERLLDRYRLPPERVHVARPGADRGERRPARPAAAGSCASPPWSRTRGRTCCSTRSAASPAPPWCCTVVGPLDRDPPFVERLRRRAADSGMADRICFAGPRVGEELRRQYQAADVLVLPSRLEAYGMVVTEALAVGLPVIAAAVGGVPEALGRTSRRPPGSARAPRRCGRPRRGARHLAARRRSPGAAASGGPRSTGGR